MAVIKHAGGGKAVFLNIAQRPFVLRHKISTCDHGFHTVMGQRGRNIDRYNLSMGMRAAQNGGHQHAGGYSVSTVKRAARDLVIAVRAGGPCAYLFKLADF